MRRSIPAWSLASSLALTIAAATALISDAGWSSRPLLHVASARAQTAAASDRIVAAGGVITEILYAVGAQNRIVGVDTTSAHPAEAMKEKPNVGYVRALSAEGVLSLKPSLVLAIDGAGPPDALKLIAESGVRMVTVPEDFSADGVVARIRKVAEIGGAAERGEALAREVSDKFRALAAARDNIKTPKRILFVLSFQNGKLMAGGKTTSADAIIRLAGGVNAMDAIEGYKPVSDEAVIAAAPDFILVMNRGDHAMTADQAFATPSLSLTPAAKTRGFASMDGLYLLGFGPRTPDAARDLMNQIYGSAASGKS